MRDLAILAASTGLMALAVFGALATTESSNTYLQHQACLESARLDHRPATDCQP